MNVADLLHDAPSSQRRPPPREQPQAQQPPQQPQQTPSQPPHRERSRERERQPSGHSQHLPPPPHQHLHPSQSYHGHSSRSSRPGSPHRTFPPDYPGSHQQAQRLPPPSAILSDYDLKHRRPEFELPPLPHELGLRQQHGQQPSMGPPGPPPHSYDHRPPGPPSRSSSQSSHSHNHHHSHSHGPPGGSSPMYLPPPGSRSSMPSSKLGSSPPGPGMPPSTGHGSIPLFPTPVGPGMGPPHLESHPRGPPGSFSEQSPMYSGPPPGSGPLSRLPPQGHLVLPHERRHRRGSSGGHSSQGTSPAMSSLQRSPYDERDAGRGPPMGPPSQFGGGMGPGPSVGRPDHRSTSTMSARAPPQMLTGPGAAGMHGDTMSLKDRERLEREKERERERESRSVERRERERVEMMREREMYEAEREKAHRMWERERREEEKMRDRERRESHDLMTGMLGGDRMLEAEREREWIRKNHSSNMVRVQEQQVWPRFAHAREDPREREVREIERQREMEMARIREMEERRVREEMDLERMERMERVNRQMSQGRTGGRERDMREKERPRDVTKEAGRERVKEPRRGTIEEHGWLPEPRAPEGWGKDPERERDRQMREQMHLQRERELHERERELAAREREEMEAVRNRYSASHHHHHLHHHHHRHPAPPSAIPGHAQGHIVSSKSGKMGRQPEPIEMAIGPGAGLPAPFDKVITNLPPPPSHKHSKTPIVTTPNQSLPPQMMPGHFHPSNHLQMPPHPHAPPLGFQDHRPTSPPFKNALTAPRPNISMQSRSPCPPIMPTLKPRHLGTFVHPRLPFPFLDFIVPLTDPVTTPTSAPLAEKETREIRAIILIPSGFVPTEKPKQPRIWGGALIPSFSPLFATPQLVTHVQSGLTWGFVRPHPYEIHGGRRVYTDDSDLFLCALHAGWITWSMARKARKEGKDLRLEIRLSKESRYPGGLGSKFMGATDGQDVPGDDDGSTLLSAGWGNSHDGAGVEIMRAEFVKVGTARKLGLRNRAQRILEYSERASALGCMSPLRKRRRVDPVSDDDLEEYNMTPASDADLCASRTVAFSRRMDSNNVGFKYDPDVIKDILFSVDERPRKKARLSDSNALQMDVDGGPASANTEPAVTKKAPSIVVETLVETFLISPQEGPVDVEDKENADSSPADSSVKYTISLVHVSQPPPSSPKALPAKVPIPPIADEAKTRAESNPQPMRDEEPLAPVPEAKASVAPQPTESAPKSADGEAQVEGQPKAESVPSEDTAAQSGAPQPVPAAVVESSAGPSGAEPKTAEGETKLDDKVADMPKVNGAPARESVIDSSTDTAPAEVAVPIADSPKPEPAKGLQPVIDEDVSMAEVTEPAALNAAPKRVTTLEVLHRGVGQDDLLFDAEGISVLTSQVENGMRKGWKIEARSWRWATEELTTDA